MYQIQGFRNILVLSSSYETVCSVVLHQYEIARLWTISDEICILRAYLFTLSRREDLISEEPALAAATCNYLYINSPHDERILPMKVLAVLAVLVTYVLRLKVGCSWWYAIPLYFGFFLAYHGYRMLIHERFINPISKLPGPKVDVLVTQSLSCRDIGSGESFMQFSVRSQVKPIFAGCDNTEIQLVLLPTPDYSTHVDLCQHLVVLSSMF